MTVGPSLAKRMNGFWGLGFLGLALTLGATSRVHAQQPDGQDAQPAQEGSGGYDPASVSPASDPPSRIGRLSVIQGNVSVEPASVNEFSPAELNYPLTTGDRVWADNGGEAEIEAGQLAARLGEVTDLSVTAMTDTLTQFGLGQGSVHLRTFALDQGTTTELDTPNIAVTVLQPGDVRVDVDPNSDTTIVTLISGQVEVDGNGLQQTLEPGQRVQFAGTDPVSAQWLQAAGGDGLDAFSQSRDQAMEGGQAAEESYLNADTVGGADLAQYGDWSSDATYGAVWYPATVVVGWQPYCHGHWTWIAPWGWTWVENEPWGFAPFHYGRWAMVGGRWGWVPGPPVIHPVYSPGFVVFVGAGAGVSAWFPLGPGEPYAPWYHASALYLNRVNVTNIYSRNPAQIRAIYATSNREVYADPLGTQQRFLNRSVATIAVPQTSFAAGKPVASAQLHLPAAQLTAATVLPHPLVTPERSMVAPAVARAVPPHPSRPTLESRQDAAIHAGASNSQPESPRASGESGQPAPVERRPAPIPQPSASMGQENERPTQPVRGTEQLPATDSTPPDQTLYNRAVPPPARPSFDQQREAIQSMDPGRPLSPQQLNNLRDNRPVGQPQTREAAPHPAPAPRSAPPARSSPPPAPRSNGKH
jgi:hypothetical protein